MNSWFFCHSNVQNMFVCVWECNIREHLTAQWVILTCWLSCGSLFLTGIDERTNQASWASGGESSPTYESSRVRWPTKWCLWVAFPLHSTSFNTHYIKVVNSQCVLVSPHPCESRVLWPIIDIYLCGREDWLVFSLLVECFYRLSE